MAETDEALEAEVIALLSNPASFAGHPRSVEAIETHAARIFLAGSEAVKIKRPVRYSYLDFSTAERRRRALERELEINQPAAPGIYRDVVAIVRTPSGELALGGEGEVVDWCLRMHRFDGTKLLSRLAGHGPLADAIVHALAQSVAGYHDRAVPHVSAALGGAAMEALIEELRAELGKLAPAAPAELVDGLLAHVAHRLELVRDLLDRRARSGFVRRCHGDLHLGNIVLVGERPVLFDALEFDERLATIDTLYDLAFLVMDLDQCGQRAAANLLLNRYLITSSVDADIEGLAALPLFLSLRAAIRGMTALQQSVVGSQRRATSYLEAAVDYAMPAPPRLVAVGGLSGTGKSTVAKGLAPRLGAAPGALHLRSDIERKRLLGRPELERLAPECYTHQMSARVYARLLAEARLALTAGQAVVLDAVFATPEERQAVDALARALDIPFTGLWLTAPAEILTARVTARRGDASDADAEVVARQLAWDVGEVSWLTVNAGTAPADTLAAARSALSLS